MEEQWITSVGIDLGTSTTKLIVSRLRLGRMSSHFSLPRFQIVERQLRYASPIYTTPLKNMEEIDTEKVFSLLADEYRKAQLNLSEVKSGAVIITGETATKSNAEQIVHYLAERSGDFVVATAGADLEGVLAGKGAGAEKRSRQIHGVVANIDIGGGTANAAFFQRGKVVGTVTFHVGGRLIRLDEAGVVSYVSPHLAVWLKENGFTLAVGQQTTYEQLWTITSALNRAMLSYVTGKTSQADIQALLLGPPMTRMPPIDELMISGGIGQLMTEPRPQTLAQAAIHGDIGPILAHSLQAELGHFPVQTITPEQTVRATVIGAGMQSTEISGSTVHLHPASLPLRNIPVIKLELEPAPVYTADFFRERVGQMMEFAYRLFGDESSPPFALAMNGLPYCSYATLQLLADQLAGCYHEWFGKSRLMVVVCENDMAKALGQALTIRCQGKPDIICIDQIKVEYGDYIDLGEPISEAMIPVVIKTLAFHERT